MEQEKEKKLHSRESSNNKSASSSRPRSISPNLGFEEFEEMQTLLREKYVKQERGNKLQSKEPSRSRSASRPRAISPQLSQEEFDKHQSDLKIKFREQEKNKNKFKRKTTFYTRIYEKLAKKRIILKNV